MKTIKNSIKLFLKILKYVVIKIFMMGGLFLLVGNIIRLFYSYIGKGLSFFADEYAEKHNYYIDFSGSLDTHAFEGIDYSKLFLNKCGLGVEGADGRYLVRMNKICLSPQIDPQKTSSVDKKTIYHELTHYKLRNLPIDKKLLMRDKIIKQVSLIKKAIVTINKKKFENELNSDDTDKRFFYNILGVEENATQSVYKFYDTTKDVIISHWGNEEYITYGVQYFVSIDKNTNETYYDKYTLKNPLLKEINQGYQEIFQEIGIIR